MKPISLLLVDDQNILLDVLRRQFNADSAFKVVATADTLASACAAAEEHRPEVVLLDIELGAESGLDAIGRIRAVAPDARIVMVTMFDQAIYRDRAFELGADAFVTKGASFAALRALLLGETPPGCAGRDRVWRRPGQTQAVRLTLTARELQVVQALAVGQREKEVASTLSISVSSVGTYLKRAMLKTGLRTRAELFRYAGALGVETVGGPG
jgi:DNA-binding NarL/FixJ family response regulator